MKHRALEIGSVAAFLLEPKKEKILFDSGGSGSIIKNLIKNN